MHQNRTARLPAITTDNLALSDILLFISRMAQIIEQNGENQVADTSAPSLSTASGGGIPTAEMSGDSPLPSLVGQDQAPAHLAHLTERARNYVEAASSANTRKAYASDWKHFAAWCRRSNLSPSPRIHKPSGFTLQLALPA